MIVKHFSAFSMSIYKIFFRLSFTLKTREKRNTLKEKREENSLGSFYYQGHGSFRLRSDSGAVVYVDPFAGDGYDLPADLILVTHEHPDHNVIEKVSFHNGCRVIRAEHALVNGIYQSFECKGMVIQAVPACNANHDREKCVGYVIAMDGIKLYAAGDTSYIPEMQGMLHEMKLDYAVLPADGIYNMDVEEAQKCAEAIGARHSILVHMKPGKLFDETIAERFRPVGRLLVRPGEEIQL